MLYFLCNPNEIHPSSNRASVIGCFGWFGNNQCDLRSDRGLMCTLIYFIRSIKIEFFFFFFWFMPLNMPMISYHHLSSDSHRTHNHFFLIHHWLKCQAIGAAQYNIPHDMREEVRKKNGQELKRRYPTIKILWINVTSYHSKLKRMNTEHGANKVK